MTTKNKVGRCDIFNEGNETNVGKIGPKVTELSLLQDKGIGSDTASFLAVARASMCPH